jgi:hypothetical protein
VKFAKYCEKQNCERSNVVSVSSDFMAAAADSQSGRNVVVAVDAVVIKALS